MKETAFKEAALKEVGINKSWNVTPAPDILNIP